MTNRTNGYRQVKGFGSTATICLLLIAFWIAMGVHSGEAFGAEQLEYLDERGNSAYIDDYTVLTKSIDTIGDDEWYVVQGNLEPTSKVITVNGTAKLLLTNGCRLSAERISVTGGNRLEIYAQSTDKTRMGMLECHQKTPGGAGRAAIGGDEGEDAGGIIIWGGHISASATGAAAIGGGVGQKSGLVAIKDGVVKASSNDPSSAVIGGARQGRGGSVIIDGGEVDVTGGGIGIGAGRQSENEVSVSISAGTVTAQGDGNGYVAIGADQEDGDKPGAAAKVAIGGGHVTAISSSEYSGIGIGSKKGATIRINGGTVKAKGKDAGVGAMDPKDTEITIGWKNDTDSYYADSVKGNVKFDPNDRFIYKVEPGNIYTGSKEVDPTSINGNSTIIPYVYTVQYDKGVQGTGGTMPEHGANPNHDFYLPECDFICADDYVFNKWKIGDEEYAAGDKVKFKGDTTVTATWKKKGIPLKVSNIKAKDKTFDGESGAPLARAAVKKNSMTIGWNKIQGAEGYDIFFATCKHGHKKIACKNVKTIKGNKTFKWTKSGLKKGTAYKFYVRAYITKNGKKTYVSKSPMFHAYTANGTKNYTNAKSVSLKNVKKGKLSMKKGKTFKIKAKVKKISKKKKLMPKSHAPVLRYMTSNKKVATVSKAGKITAKGKGTCYVYVYAHNGVSKSIKVTVK